MKVIIAGGRNTRLAKSDRLKLDTLNIIEVVSGGATGIDTDGEAYAVSRGIPFKQFCADWNKYGKSAGPIRNKKMASYADAVALFPGGIGTKSMYLEAVKAGIKIYDFR